MDEEGDASENEGAQVFQCPICLDTLNYPVSLPCGHVLCFECLQQSTMNIEKRDCPVCQHCFKPEDLRPIYVGKDEGEDPRRDMVKKFRLAEELRNQKLHKEMAANHLQLQLRFNLGGFMFPGMQMNFGNVAFGQRPGRIFGRQIEQPDQPPRRLVGDMTLKEKVKYYSLLALKLVGLLVFLIFYIKIMDFQQINTVRVINNPDDEREQIVYTRGPRFFFI